MVTTITPWPSRAARGQAFRLAVRAVYDGATDETIGELLDAI